MKAAWKSGAILLTGTLLLLSGCLSSEYKRPLKQPGALLVYYGWPSLINGSGDPAGEFAKYDYVILGAGLEKSTHPDHTATKSILQNAALEKTTVFGYIDLGVTTSNHALPEISTRIEEWIETGATGIFFDNCGADFGTTRSRQNITFEYVHQKGLPILANSWDPDDLFGPGEPTELTSSDFYLWESFQIKEGNYDTKETWNEKRKKIESSRRNIGFQILCLTTTNSVSFEPDQFHYAWYSSLLCEAAAIGWGEVNFSTDTTAPWRPRPQINPGLSWESPLREQAELFRRQTELGKVEINTTNHSFGFIPTP